MPPTQGIQSFCLVGGCASGLGIEILRASSRQSLVEGSMRHHLKYVLTVYKLDTRKAVSDFTSRGSLNLTSACHSPYLVPAFAGVRLSEKLNTVRVLSV